MTREDKCKIAINIGYTYDNITGIIYNTKGLEVKRKNNGYIQCRVYKDGKGYNLLGHQLAWYITNKNCVDCIDHINGIKDDNRIINLRSITHQENQFNQHNNKGYSFNKNGKYEARISIDKKLIYIGSYNTESEAKYAYLEAKKIYHNICQFA